jgi:hypothetical protein
LSRRGFLRACGVTAAVIALPDVPAWRPGFMTYRFEYGKYAACSEHEAYLRTPVETIETPWLAPWRFTLNEVTWHEEELWLDGSEGPQGVSIPAHGFDGAMLPRLENA